MSDEGELEPVEITKSNPFAVEKTSAAAPAKQVEAASADAPAAAANAAGAGMTLTPTPTPHPSPKRKKNPSSRSPRGGGEDEEDDEIAEDRGDSSTLAHEVQLRKIHQTFKKCSNRLDHKEDQIEGQGRMVDEVSAKRRTDEQEKISVTYGIM